MNPLGQLGTYDCSNCQALCCVASGRKSLPGKLSLSTGHSCPNIARVGDCVSCGVHDTLNRDPSMVTCHLFDCRGLGNRFSDMMKKAGVHWMKDAPLPPEKQIVFDNVVYYFDIISTALTFLSGVQKSGLGGAYDIGIAHIEGMLQKIDMDCQNSVSSRDRLVDFWMGMMVLVKQLPFEVSVDLKTIQNTHNLYEVITRDLCTRIDQIQSGLSQELGPVLREYAFSYGTITLVETAIHGKKFDPSFHERAVNQVCKNTPGELQEGYRALLNVLYRPLTVGFKN